MEHDGFAREHLVGQGVRFERNRDFVFRRIVDEAVLVPTHQPVAQMDAVYTLNEVGAFVWQRLETPATQAEVHQAILDAYDIGPETAADDLSAFLLRMIDIGAVRCLAPGRVIGPARNF